MQHVAASQEKPGHAPFGNQAKSSASVIYTCRLHEATYHSVPSIVNAARDGGEMPSTPPSPGCYAFGLARFWSPASHEQPQP
jgi:hypothetical protein